MIDREKFFRIVNRTLFNGKMNASQKEGMIRIIDEWERQKLTDKRLLAYMLGTTKHETASTMQPVIEAYWLSEEWRRDNLRYYPYYGRGLPQLTWERNYRKMTELLRHKFRHIPDFDLVKHPEQALIPEVAIAVMFEGMLRGESMRGDYTGKALEDYFTPTSSSWVAARYVVNGTDRAEEIADISRAFFAALDGKEELPARLLYYGLKGEDVKDLQRALIAKGFNPKGVDGDFGNGTKEAVKAFQRSVGIGDDGVVGDTTRRYLAA